MPDLAKLINEKTKLRKQMNDKKQDLEAVKKLSKRIQKIEEQIEKLRGE